jgi:hypothetical protein
MPTLPHDCRPSFPESRNSSSFQRGVARRAIPTYSDPLECPSPIKPGEGIGRAAIIKAHLPTNPLSTCPIGKAPLDGMDGPVNMISGNRLVQLCCDSRKAGVLKDPAAVIKQLGEARIAVRDTSPNQPTPE